MTVDKTELGGTMNYNHNYRISLWDEFKGPIAIFAFALFIMIGLNNTFYTTLSVDKKKVSVHWSSPTKSFESAPVVEPVQHVVSNPVVVAQAAPVRAYAQPVAEVAHHEVPAEEQAHANEYAIINEDISVSAAEFYHPKLNSVLSGTAISGYLEVQAGEVKGLSVNINSDKAKDIGIQTISMGESELQGNIFVYEVDGQNYTGTIYPTSPNEYMVSFVNGPWNGARVKFSAQENANPQTEEPIYNDDSYSAPETDMTNREWASSED